MKLGNCLANRVTIFYMINQTSFRILPFIFVFATFTISTAVIAVY